MHCRAKQGDSLIAKANKRGDGGIASQRSWLAWGRREGGVFVDVAASLRVSASDY